MAANHIIWFQTIYRDQEILMSKVLRTCALKNFCRPRLCKKLPYMCIWPYHQKKLEQEERGTCKSRSSRSTINRYNRVGPQDLTPEMESN